MLKLWGSDGDVIARSIYRAGGRLGDKPSRRCRVWWWW